MNSLGGACQRFLVFPKPRLENVFPDPVEYSWSVLQPQARGSFSRGVDRVSIRRS